MKMENARAAIADQIYAENETVQQSLRVFIELSGA
jgi:hypothetical protein